MSDEQSPAEQSLDAATSATPARSNTRQYVMLGFLLFAIIASFGAIARWGRHEARRQQAITAEVAAPEFTRPDPVGSLEAKLKIEACQGECSSYVMDALAEVARAYPDRIRAEFYAYEAAEGSRFLAERDEGLQSIYVNGQSEFTIGEGDAAREVSFIGLAGLDYGLGDLQTVLRERFEDLYGEVPPGFDAKLDLIIEYGPPEEGPSHVAPE